ncbi:TetR/AcrR family transcriptional regulator [Stutzerimonas chloritidismutans]|uniref:TetR/AcrR family transcriptional regulator n=1 Tax=Stutzerimonas chloritidismutans TaxID=203192 RepID=UPI003F172C27
MKQAANAPETGNDAEKAPRIGRKNNPEKTRRDILEAAIAEFVQQGLSGARVDAIAERTRTSKRMIYYYFGNKEQLYLRVLERLYGDIRNNERTLQLAEFEPREAMRRLVEFTFDDHERNPGFIRIVCVENIHHGEYVKRSEAIRSMSNTALELLDQILQRGEAEGVFRPGLQALDVHLLINSFCFYRNSNRHTFGHIFQIKLHDAPVRARHREMISDAVLRYLQA